MSNTVLMCPPKYFDIEYEINPWMHRSDQPSGETAVKQWQKLYEIYTQKLGWSVELIDPVKGLPDMAFATDCCLIKNGKIMLSSFRYPERQPETVFFERWFHDHGYNRIKKAKNFFEGGGDTMICGDKIIAGYGFRSDKKAHKELEDYLGMEV